jgi:parallel beta-helix repeat protein
MKATALALGVVALAAAPLIGATAAQASPAPQTVYVSTTGSSKAADRNCDTPAFNSVNKAVGAVATGGTVVVCRGTFHEDVTVAKSLRIDGRSNATIDATNLINGVRITAPHVTVSGLTVKNAVGEGIIVDSTSFATIVGNTVKSNNTGVRLVNPVKTDYPFCQPQNGAANDCGENIHLVGSSNNVVQGNSVTDGAGGILLSDETGPTSHNTIGGNMVADNHTACGIVLAGHNPKAAPGGVPASTVAGVFDNKVTGNAISGNGLQSTGGAGVQMATGAPGGAVYNNTVSLNAINGNGHGGVTVHSHAPGQFLNGNVVTGNQIGTNNINGDLAFPAKDTQTTAVVIGTVAPLSIKVSGNVMGPDHFGIFTSGPVTVAGEHNSREPSSAPDRTVMCAPSALRTTSPSPTVR